jgi:hypothetical protein
VEAARGVGVEEAVERVELLLRHLEEGSHPRNNELGAAQFDVDDADGGRQPCLRARMKPVALDRFRR